MKIAMPLDLDRLCRQVFDPLVDLSAGGKELSAAIAVRAP